MPNEMPINPATPWERFDRLMRSLAESDKSPAEITEAILGCGDEEVIKVFMDEIASAIDSPEPH